MLAETSGGSRISSARRLRANASACRSGRRRTLPLLELHLLDDRAELFELLAQHRVLPGRRRADRLGTDLDEPFRDVGIAHRGGDLALQPIDDLLRRLRRREETVPALGLERREA